METFNSIITNKNLKPSFFKLFALGSFAYIILFNFVLIGDYGGMNIKLIIAALAFISFLAIFFLMEFATKSSSKSILRNSGQLVATLDSKDSVSIISTGFLSQVGFETLSSSVEQSLKLHKISFQSILKRQSLAAESIVIEIELPHVYEFAKTSIHLILFSQTPIDSKFIIIGSKFSREFDDPKTSFAENNDSQEIELRTLFEDFAIQLERKLSNVKLRLSNSNIYIRKSRDCFNSFLNILQDDFSKVAGSDKNTIDVTCSLQETPYYVSVSWKWIRGERPFEISEALNEKVQTMGGKIFTSRDIYGVSELIAYFDKGTEESSDDEILGNINSIKDLAFVNQVFASIQKFILNRDFSIDLLAREIGVSRMQLHRKVKLFFNTSPGSLFQMQRMRKAQELLKNEENRIADVAYLLGYCDQSHFTKAFKSCFGFPPVEYQRRNAA